MIDQSEPVNWPNVWWMLGADHLTFEGVMGAFRKKCPADWFREEKSMLIDSWEKNILHWKEKSLMTYNAKKKTYTVICWEKILPIQTKSVKSPIPHSPTNVQWYGHVNHLGGEGRNGFDTFVRNVIYQQNGWRAFTICWFSRLKFCISVCGIFFLNHSAPPSKGVWCGRLLGMWRFLSFFLA